MLLVAYRGLKRILQLTWMGALEKDEGLSILKNAEHKKRRSMRYGSLHACLYILSVLTHN